MPALTVLVLVLPFLLTFEGPSLGVGLVTDSGSKPVRFALFWLAPTLPLLLSLVLSSPRVGWHALVKGMVFAAVPVAIWVVTILLFENATALVSRGSGWITLAVLVGMVGSCMTFALAAERLGRIAQAGALALASAAAALVLTTELLFLEDAFGTRMNTVFKLWFHAWLLLAVAGGVAVGSIVAKLTPLTSNLMFRDAASIRGSVVLAMVLVLGGVLFLSSLIYAPAAAIARSREGQHTGLDSLAYLDRTVPGEAAALRWVREELDARESLLLEAVGSSYGTGNRISAASGIPTLLGWPGHELQWRRDPPIIELMALVERVYTAGATEQTRLLLVEHGVTHIYFGAEERRQHGGTVAERFTGWPVVFESLGVLVVQVPSEEITSQNGHGRESVNEVRTDR